MCAHNGRPRLVRRRNILRHTHLQVIRKAGAQGPGHPLPTDRAAPQGGEGLSALGGSRWGPTDGQRPSGDRRGAPSSSQEGHRAHAAPGRGDRRFVLPAQPPPCPPSSGRGRTRSSGGSKPPRPSGVGARPSTKRSMPGARASAGFGMPRASSPPPKRPARGASAWSTRSLVGVGGSTRWCSRMTGSWSSSSSPSAAAGRGLCPRAPRLPRSAPGPAALPPRLRRPVPENSQPAP